MIDLNPPLFTILLPLYIDAQKSSINPLYRKSPFVHLWSSKLKNGVLMLPIVACLCYNPIFSTKAHIQATNLFEAHLSCWVRVLVPWEVRFSFWSEFADGSWGHSNASTARFVVWVIFITSGEFYNSLRECVCVSESSFRKPWSRVSIIERKLIKNRFLKRISIQIINCWLIDWGLLDWDWYNILF